MGKSKITQRDRILDYIDKIGYITSYQAYIDLGVTQLATRIFELKKLGYEFETSYITKENRYGEPCKFLKYRLVGVKDDKKMC